jgi:hypothetical protein
MAAIPFIGVSFQGKPDEVVTDGIRIKGDIQVETHGIWAGTCVLERNEKSSGWVEHCPPFESDMNLNYSYMGQEECDGAEYRLNFTNVTDGRIEVTVCGRTAYIYEARIWRNNEC